MTNGFPEGFTEENNSDPYGEDDLKFTQENIQMYFLLYFKQANEKEAYTLLIKMKDLTASDNVLMQTVKQAA